jgi:uncharacterized protein
MKVVMTGSTGMLGRAIAASLVARGDFVVAISRSPARWELSGLQSMTWSAAPGTDEPWRREVHGADAVINLSGEPILGKRWTDAFMRRLRASRLDATNAVVESIRDSAIKPKVLLNASATGCYGDAGDRVVDESSPLADDFTAQLVQDWESAAKQAEQLTRVVLLRIGIVLGPTGGALAKMLPLFKLGLGGRVGSGKQWVSWIHQDDLVSLVLRAIDDATVAGPINLVAPHPVTNAELTRTLGRLLRRPTLFPAPAFALKLLLGQASHLLLSGARVRLAHPALQNFRFAHPELEDALRDVLKQQKA